MFYVNYVYMPMSGKPYISSDMGVAVDIETVDDEVSIVFHHRAKDMNEEVVNFTSRVIVPPQKILVETVS